MYFLVALLLGGLSSTMSDVVLEVGRELNAALQIDITPTATSREVNLLPWFV